VKHSILIIDDSPPLHKLVRSILEVEPVVIHSAYCGEEGLAMAAQLKPALILLDVDMPKMDGFEVCRRLKAEPTTQFIPTAFLTAKMTLKHKVDGLNIGRAITLLSLSSRKSSALEFTQPAKQSAIGRSGDGGPTDAALEP